MSFFQSLKEDLSTAMNDLITDEGGFENAPDLSSFDELKFEDGEPLLSNLPKEEAVKYDEPEYAKAKETVPEETSPVQSALDSLKNASRRYEDEKNSNAETDEIEELLKGIIPEEEPKGEETAPFAEEETLKETEEETPEIKETVSDDAQLEFDLDAMLQSLESEGDTVENKEPEESAETPLTSEISDIVETTETIPEMPTEEPGPEMQDTALEELMKEYKEKFPETAKEPEPEVNPEPETVAEPETIAEPEPAAKPELIAEPEVIPEPEPTAKPEDEAAVIDEPAPEAVAAPVSEDKPEEKPAPKKEKKAKAKKAKIPEIESVPLEKQEISEETAVIAEGMKIVGDIECTGNIDLSGEIAGNVSLLGKLDVTGKITGKIKAFEVFADGAKINGDITSNGSVKLGQDTVVIGNIAGASAVIAGAVKGDIDVHGPVILDSSAIVMGNIKSMSVQINNGAVIEGMCSQCYATVNPESFFNDFKRGN